MKNYASPPRFATLVAFFLLFFVACRKELDHPLTGGGPAGSLTERDLTSGLATFQAANEFTLLGSPKSIPYSVNTIRDAYNSLYNLNLTTLAPNYLYVRFLPNTPADVKALLDSGLEFWDFPLHYEITAMGKRYHDPAVANPNFTWQYTVIPVDMPMPNVQYEVIQQLALVPEECRVAQKAFELTQNTYDAPDEFVADPQIKDGKVDFKMVPTPPDGGGGSYPDPTPSAGNPLLNPQACGCATAGHSRNPAGCVTVEDNRLHVNDPVREVRVRVSRTHIFGWLFHRSTYTNATGCWEIKHQYKSRVYVWVIFESATCNIKTMSNNLDLWDYTFARRDYVGSYDAPNLNGISIHFPWTNDIDTSKFRGWAAATANNSIYETQRYFTSQNLPHPPGNLKVLLTCFEDRGNVGSAPMLDKAPGNTSLLTAATLVGGVLYPIEVSIINLFEPAPDLGVPPSIGPVLAPLSVWLGIAAPDIIFNASRPSDINSDDVREILYHELAHSIHFMKAGDAYWLDEIIFTILHNGYGTGTESGSGRVQVVESWGFQMGYNMAHLRYGSAHSEGNTTWFEISERNLFFDDFIPYGWQHDLIDNANAEEPTGVNSLPLLDNVTGITRKDIFNTMGSGTVTVQFQKNEFQTLLPSRGITQTSYNALNAGYGL